MAMYAMWWRVASNVSRSAAVAFASGSVSPGAERFRPNIVRKSSPIGIANSAMPSRLLAMHFCLMLCFRLCHLLIAAGYHTGDCWPRRWLNGFTLGGFWDPKSTSVPYRCLR